MTGSRAVVFLAGEYEDDACSYYLEQAEAADLIVAADAGAAFLVRHGVQADVVVGDFDSLSVADLKTVEGSGAVVQRHPLHKDLTDGELAVTEALRRGASEVIPVGAYGALDHTLGHRAIMRRLAAQGVIARLTSSRLAVRVLTGSRSCALDSAVGTRVSLVPLDEGAVLSIHGFRYSLCRSLLAADECRGLGNVIAALPATITVHAGAVVVLVESGSESFGAARRAARPA